MSFPRSCSSSSASFSSTSSSNSNTFPGSPISPPTHPIQIGFTPGISDTLRDTYSRPRSSSVSSSICATPSWPHRASLCSGPIGVPSSYISDEDLLGDFGFGDKSRTPYLSEAPEPPRPAGPMMAMPLLPLVASARPKSQRRRGSKMKERRLSKPMTPIEE